MDKDSLEATASHMVMPRDLNHHETLYAGRMTDWLVEASSIAAARLFGKDEDVLFIQVNDNFTFQKPINNGDFIEIKSRIAYLGSTSITVFSQVFRQHDDVPLVTNIATFVTVDEENKPYKHGLKLSEEYIAANRDIYQEALKLRPAK